MENVNQVRLSELLKSAEVLQLTGRTSRQWLYDMLKRDETFPRPRRVPGGQVVWVRSELMDWIRALPVAEYNGLSFVENRKFSQEAQS